MKLLFKLVRTSSERVGHLNSYNLSRKLLYSEGGKRVCVCMTSDLNKRVVENIIFRVRTPLPTIPPTSFRSLVIVKLVMIIYIL